MKYQTYLEDKSQFKSLTSTFIFSLVFGILIYIYKLQYLQSNPESLSFLITAVSLLWMSLNIFLWIGKGYGFVALTKIYPQQKSNVIFRFTLAKPSNLFEKLFLSVVPLFLFLISLLLISGILISN